MNNFYSYQSNLEKIDKQIEDLTQIKNQIRNSRQPVIQQNFVQPFFQSDFDAKWVDSRNEINNIPVTRDSIFMDRNNPMFYLKNTNGEIKSYDFTEHIELDEKDLKIKELEEKIAKMEGEIENGKSFVQPKPKSK